MRISFDLADTLICYDGIPNEPPLSLLLRREPCRARIAAAVFELLHPRVEPALVRSTSTSCPRLHLHGEVS